MQTVLCLPASFRVSMAIVGLGMLALGAGRAAGQTTYIVNVFYDSVDTLPGDGVCTDAFGNCSLRAAVMEATANSGVVQIVLPTSGNYVLSIGGVGGAAAGDLDINPVPAMTELQILGTGAGATFIMANGFPAAQADRVFHLRNTIPATTSIVLSGMTLQFGQATGFNGTTGGAILHEGGILKLLDLQIEGSTATTGAGLWSSQKVEATNSGASGCVATGDGGGMYLASGAQFDGTDITGWYDQANRGAFMALASGATAKIQSGTMQFNQATQGGVFRNLGSLTVSDVTLSTNHAVGGGNGGAIANQSPGAITLERVIMDSNTADNGGGAINNQFNGLIRASECVFRLNHATNLGGAISNAGDLTLTRCGITNNHSDGLVANAAGGGGIYNQNAAGIVRAVNCTIDGNTAVQGLGGGIENDFSGTVELSACTLVFNGAAPGSGNSIYNGNTLGAAATLRIIGTIVDDTMAPPGSFANIVAPSPLISLGHNIDVDGTGLLTDPTDQSGTMAAPIDTKLAFAPCGPALSFLPQPGSPAIDRGFCADVAGNVLTIDQCGNPRPVDGDGNGIIECDVGAFEAPPAVVFCGTCPGDVNGDNFVDGRDAQQFVACWLGGTPAAPGCGCADMNGDGLFDPALPDLPVFVAKLLNDPNPRCP